MIVYSSYRKENIDSLNQGSPSASGSPIYSNITPNDLYIKKTGDAATGTYTFSTDLLIINETESLINICGDLFYADSTSGMIGIKNVPEVLLDIGDAQTQYYPEDGVGMNVRLIGKNYASIGFKETLTGNVGDIRYDGSGFLLNSDCVITGTTTVGIGTSNPLTEFNVKGSISIIGQDTAPPENLEYGFFSGTGATLGLYSKAGNVSFWTEATPEHILNINTTYIGTPNFISGFSGYGWRVDVNNSNYTLHVDNLVVRKSMTVYELIINKIRATNGSLWVSDAAELFDVEYLWEDDTYKCWVDVGSAPYVSQPFVVNDIVRCQVWTGTGIKYYTGEVIEVEEIVGYFFVIALIDATGVPEVGDVVVRVGNTNPASNRQGAVYITASDSGAPYIDVLDGVSSMSFEGKTKVRLGKLSGITDSDFGSNPLEGYGLYSSNVYLKGKLVIASGSSGYSNISDKPSSLSTINSTEYNNLQTLAKSSSLGKMLYTDPTFARGNNDATLYNYGTGSAVTLSRVSAASDSPNYDVSDYELEITYTSGLPGTVWPGFGGFYFATGTRPNCIFVVKIIAKIPEGRSILYASNAHGNDPVEGWVTSNAGTGRYEEYIYSIKCGSTGTFSSVNYFYINGGDDTTFSWRVAFATVYDVTDSGVPSTLAPPSGTGLFLDSTHMGYYTSNAWKTYIDNSGNMILGDYAGGGTGLAWNQDTAVLSIRGKINATEGDIGGWAISSSYLIKDTGTSSTSCGLVPADYPFFAGANYSDRASAPFRVTNEGAVTMTKATIQTNNTGQRVVIDSSNNNMIFYGAATGDYLSVDDDDIYGVPTLRINGEYNTGVNDALTLTPAFLIIEHASGGASNDVIFYVNATPYNLYVQMKNLRVNPDLSGLKQLLWDPNDGVVYHAV